MQRASRLDVTSSGPHVLKSDSDLWTNRNQELFFCRSEIRPARNGFQ
jgi:hypothetical protein